MRSAGFMGLINDVTSVICRFIPPDVSTFTDESRSKIFSPRDEMFDICSNSFLRRRMRDMPSTHLLIERSRPHV
jgi:hypothetical protein